jgi:hypothetical protein
VTGTAHGSTLEVAVAERRALMRAAILEGVETITDAPHRDFATLEADAHDLARRPVVDGAGAAAPREPFLRSSEKPHPTPPPST